MDEEHLRMGRSIAGVAADGGAPEALRPADVERIREAARVEIERHPPTLGVIGVSGVGKSSTLNALFRTGLPTSDTVACTKDFLAVQLEIEAQHGRVAGLNVPLRVVDAPGLGEDIERDASYIEQYLENLPACDAILWVTAARSRAVSLDQMYLELLSDFHDRMVFGINQIDVIEPLNWSEQVNLPSTEQEQRLDEILGDRREKLESVVGRPIAIEAYSAKRGFGLQAIFTALIEAMPAERAWIYSDLKNFSYDDFVPADLRGLLADSSSHGPSGPAASSSRRSWWTGRRP